MILYFGSQRIYAARVYCQLLGPSSKDLAGNWPLCASVSFSVRRPFPPRLELLHRVPQQLLQSTYLSRPRMEAVGATSAIVGLAIPVFKSAKALRDRIKLVRYRPRSLCTLRGVIIMFAGRIGESGTLGSAHRI